VRVRVCVCMRVCACVCVCACACVRACEDMNEVGLLALYLLPARRERASEGDSVRVIVCLSLRLSRHVEIYIK